MRMGPWPSTPAPEHADAPERIEWLELFFDLVVVAAVAVLTEGLRADATWGGLGIFLVTYGAVWFAWVSVVMYTDVAAELPVRGSSRCCRGGDGRPAPGQATAHGRRSGCRDRHGRCSRLWTGPAKYVLWGAALVFELGVVWCAANGRRQGSTIHERLESTRRRSRADARAAARNASPRDCTRSASIASTSTSGSGCS